MSLIEQRESHYEKFFGPINGKVMHSTDFKKVHVDIYTFGPTEERPFYTLVTGGMSDARQNIPAQYAQLAPRAEILTYTREPQGWMYNVLKGLAEMPSDDNTFLHWYHSVPNGMPMTAKPSELTAFLFLPPYPEDPGINPMIVDGDATDFLMMVPITNAEMEFKRKYGTKELVQKFDEANFNFVINEERTSVV